MLLLKLFYQDKMQKKIYDKGIKFKCQGSANCCVSRGSYGFVFLSKKDLLSHFYGTFYIF